MAAFSDPILASQDYKSVISRRISLILHDDSTVDGLCWDGVVVRAGSDWEKEAKGRPSPIDKGRIASGRILPKVAGVPPRCSNGLSMNGTTAGAEKETKIEGGR